MLRPVAERDIPALCSEGGVGHRVYSVPTIVWAAGVHPVRGASWYEVFDKSPREMARDPSVERYDPTGPVAPVKEDRRPALERAFRDASAMHGGAGEH